MTPLELWCQATKAAAALANVGPYAYVMIGAGLSSETLRELAKLAEVKVGRQVSLLAGSLYAIEYIDALAHGVHIRAQSSHAPTDAEIHELGVSEASSYRRLTADEIEKLRSQEDR